MTTWTATGELGEFGNELPAESMLESNGGWTGEYANELSSEYSAEFSNSSNEYMGEAIGETISPFVVRSYEHADNAREAVISAEVLELFEAAITPFAHAERANDRDVLVHEFANELAGTGLGEALGELVQEWAGVHAELASNGGQGETPASHATARQMIERQAAEVAAQTDRMFEAIVAEWGHREVTSLNEGELSQLMEALETAPIPAEASPAQEQFFKAIARGIGKVVSGAVGLVKRGVSLVGKVVTAPLRFIFARLGKLVRPLLRRVLTWAIGRLPIHLRPVANAVRRRLFGAESAEGPSGSAGEFNEFNEFNEYGEYGEIAEYGEAMAWHELLELSAGELPAVGEITTLETEFHTLLAESLTAESEDELAQLEGEFSLTTTETEAGGATNELDAARVTLIRELAALRPGESAGPAIERFLPAVLPILRIGVRIIGRRRVVGFLANLLAGLVRPLVGPQLAVPLSQAVVDAGLRIFGFEMTPEDRELAASTVTAGVLEDTIRRVAEQGEAVFEDTNRLHTETIAAFQEAVAHSVPGTLLRSDHEDREVPGANPATWLMRPRVYWYRKYSQVFQVKLTQQMAQSIVTFGGVRLSDSLRAQGVRLPVTVRVHLYETLPGTYLSKIASLERHVPGMHPDGWRRFHPLGITAAGVLLGEPGLGKDVDARFLANRSTVAAGQRVFYLQLPGGGTKVLRTGVTQAWVTIDGRPTQNRIRVLVYLGEQDAQQIAGRLRTNNTTAAVLAMRALTTAAVNSLRRAPLSRVTVLKEFSTEDEAAGGAAAGAAGAGVGSAIVGKIVDKVLDLVIAAAVRLATDYAKVKSAEFIAAADNPANGVTVVVTFPAPGLSTLLRGGVIASVLQIGALRTLLGTLASRGGGVQTFPGMRRF